LVVHALAVDAIEIGGVLSIGVGFGIEVFNPEFPFRERGILLQ